VTGKTIDELRKEYPEVERAFWYAVRAHRGQKRKDNVTPYITHPIEVAEIASSMTTVGSVLTAALLHDVVEDTAVHLNDIARLFGYYVADLVADVSENKRPDRPAAETWKIRKEEGIQKIAGSGKEAKIISLSDKLSNLRSIAKARQEIGEEVWNWFNNTSKEEQGWYYRTMRDQYVGLKTTEAWVEYAALIDRIFGPDRTEREEAEKLKAAEEIG